MVREITITRPRRRAYSNVLQFKITGTLDWLGRWKPDRFDPAKIKFWSPLRRLKIALRD
ncbi:MAG: hypothetical protein ACXW2M_09460 [Candidatus Aminicenantales bacterium]